MTHVEQSPQVTQSKENSTDKESRPFKAKAVRSVFDLLPQEEIPFRIRRRHRRSRRRERHSNLDRNNSLKRGSIDPTRASVRP